MQCDKFSMKMNFLVQEIFVHNLYIKFYRCSSQVFEITILIFSLFKQKLLFCHFFNNYS